MGGRSDVPNVVVLCVFCDSLILFAIVEEDVLNFMDVDDIHDDLLFLVDALVVGVWDLTE
jgi:hypothetical protein